MKSLRNQEKNRQTKVPKQKYNILLAAGLLSITLGLVLLFFSFERFSANSFFVRPVILLLFGCFSLYRGLTITRRTLSIFMGMFLSFFGTLVLVVDSGVTQLTFYQLWPTVVILCGIALVPSGIYKYKRFHPAFAVPAIVLVLMGCFFMLFSLNVIRQPLLSLAAQWWPLLLVAAGCAMIILFACIQHHRAVLFKDGEDDEDVG